MNDTPQGDGNSQGFNIKVIEYSETKIRMNDTPQGDGNYYCLS